MLRPMKYEIGITPAEGGEAVIHKGNDRETALEAIRDAGDASQIYAKCSMGNGRSIEVASDGEYPVITVMNELRAWLGESE